MNYEQNRLSDYVDVASRIVEFRSKYPEGRLRPANLDKPFDVTVIGDKTFIVYVAAAYRASDDTLPGVGMAWEPFPGRTPYTKDSELQNAETAAWGRAIIAALAADAKKGVASADEVRNRQADREPYVPSEPTPEQFARFDELAKQIAAAESSRALDVALETGKNAWKSDEITTKQANTLSDAIGERRAEIQRYDSTGDSDRSGLESSSAGPGVGSDSASVGGGGSGRDGETGRVRPGVQSGVHSRGRVDRSAQAPSGDRDTPATAGG